MIRYTRRQLARYAADALKNGQNVMPHIAAYLIEQKRTKEADLLVWDIEKELEARGTVVARTTSARELDEAERAAIKQMLVSRYGSAEVILSTSIDKDLLGGVLVRTANNEFDGSMKRSINRLKALKV